MKKIIISMILCATMPGLFAADTLKGSLQTRIDGLGEEVFSASYVLVLELGKYFPVGRDGAFAIEDLAPGTYTLKSFVPGFNPSFAVVKHPNDEVLEIALSLQVVKLDPIVVSQEVPAYVFEAQKAISEPGSGVALPTGRNEFNEGVSKPEGPDLRVDIPKFVDFLQTAGEDTSAPSVEESMEEESEDEER